MTDLTLSPLAAAQLARGLADLPLALVPAPPADGRVVRLRAASADAGVLALVDRDNECLRVMTRPSESHADLDAAFWRARVARALALRHDTGVTASGDAYRLLNGAGDDVPGFMAERLGEWAVVWVAAPALISHGRALAAALLDVAAVTGVVVKVRVRGGGAGRPVQEVVGGTPPEAFVVTERGLRAEVHLLSGTNVGLFTDMREHRHALGALGRGRRVLNAFSYTGTLTVAAALGGAAEVTSVDVSEGVHRWARDNAGHNAIALDRLRFVADDAMRFVEAASASGTTYDVVLLDPPSYSAARGAPFSIERDYPRLIAAAAALLSADGWLWLASNTRRVSLPALAHQGLTAAGRHAQLVSLGGLPPDYPTRAGDDGARHLQVAIYRCE